MYGIVGVHASEFTNVRSLGGKGVQDTRLKPRLSARPFLPGSHCSGDNSFQQKCDLGDTGTMGKKIGHNRVS